MIVLLIIILIPLAYFFWYRPRYCVWLQRRDGRAVLARKNTNVFGKTIAKYGDIFGPDWVELLENGNVLNGTSGSYERNSDIVQWKSYKGR